MGEWASVLQPLVELHGQCTSILEMQFKALIKNEKVKPDSQLPLPDLQHGNSLKMVVIFDEALQLRQIQKDFTERSTYMHLRHVL